MNENYQYRELTHTIIGCAMTVHNFLGPGFTEIIYERSLLIELRRSGLQCDSQIEKQIFFRDTLVGKKRLDILVEGIVLLELKAISEIEGDCVNKILNYLKVFGLEVGLLLNFGKQSLEFKRFAYSKLPNRPTL